MTRLILALRHDRSALAAVLLLGLLVRLPFVSIDFRASSDLQEFRTWQDQAQAVGLDRVYEDGAVAYPPVWPYWLALSGWIRGQIPSGLMERDALRTALIKLPSILADVVTAGL
ncbi:MAG: hypothetical protein E6J26_09855, partial [Chloroflexi bacterium]